MYLLLFFFFPLSFLFYLGLSILHIFTVAGCIKEKSLKLFSRSYYTNQINRKRKVNILIFLSYLFIFLSFSLSVKCHTRMTRRASFNTKTSLSTAIAIRSKLKFLKGSPNQNNIIDDHLFFLSVSASRNPSLSLSLLLK